MQKALKARSFSLMEKHSYFRRIIRIKAITEFGPRMFLEILLTFPLKSMLDELSLSKSATKCSPTYRPLYN